MKPFVLYDLINNTEQVILRPERVALYNPPVRKKYSRKRAMKRFLRVVKEKLKWAAIMLAQLAISFASGILFYIAIAEKLREVRGYDAIGGEVFAAGLVAYGMFLLLQWLGDWLWTRRQ
ncbi:hypothetical protein [Blautia sp.]|uniref:hypothetical protein n=1 Tax=Blautia sp. TaxID=1955243 RepID=UPI003FD79C84